MANDNLAQGLRLGIVGSGAMGRGVAQIAAQAGCQVFLYDAREGAVKEAMDFVAAMLDRQAEKGRLARADADAAKGRLTYAGSLGELAGCDMVLEAIVEELEAKQTLFRELERIVSADAILATNTSSLSVTAIASVCSHPERVAGFHFFNPVPLMRIVEVVPGVRTGPGVADRLAALAEAMGHYPARTTDTPGFLVNHAGRGYYTEALRIQGEGIADVYTLDRILRDAVGFRMGPFELLDLTGLDVSHRVMESIYHQFYEEPRFRPSPLTRQRLTAGLLGRKSGAGFYTYADGRRADPEPPVLGPGEVRPIWVSPADREASTALIHCLQAAGVEVEGGPSPTKNAVCLVTPRVGDTTTTAVEGDLDPARTLAVDMFYGLDARRTLMTNPLTDPAFRDSAVTALSADGVPVECIHDSPGFVVPRVVATIVNIGCDIAQQRIAEPATVDRAVELGLGYPRGPLSMGDCYGPERILEVLKGLYAYYGDPRYRPSPWLKRRAKLGVSLTTPEN